MSHHFEFTEGLNVFIFVRKIAGATTEFHIEPKYINVTYKHPPPAESDMVELCKALKKHHDIDPPRYKKSKKEKKKKVPSDVIVTFHIPFGGTRGRLVSQTAERVDLDNLPLTMLFVQKQAEGVRL